MQYNWVSYFLEKNEKILWKKNLNIVKVMEEKSNFIQFISSLNIKNWVNVFIWEENISNFFKDYTIILKPIIIEWKTGYIGIVGSLKMDYSFNISAISGII
jgi:transcriptional regulator of heat shock response